MQALGRNQRLFEARKGGWSLASPQPEMDSLQAGTPFESLTALREIEGVARPTTTFKTFCFVGSATVPTKKVGMAFSWLGPDHTSRSGLKQSLVAAGGLH